MCERGIQGRRRGSVCGERVAGAIEVLFPRAFRLRPALLLYYLYMRRLVDEKMEVKSGTKGNDLQNGFGVLHRTNSTRNAQQYGL